MVTDLGLDAMAMADALGDRDAPKVDDYGDHVVVVLHGLTSGKISTCEIDCFLTDEVLVTIRSSESRALDALWDALQSNHSLTTGGPDELLGRLGHVLSRRFLSIVDALDERIESLTEMALSAHPELLGDVTAIRSDLATIRRVLHPQRETFDELRRSESELISEGGKRRFADAFDVAERAAHEVDAARSALSELLEAYRGAEAREATEVSRVLTVYAAIMLPLSLVAGFFGMNFPTLPGGSSTNGWIIVLIAMIAVAAVSFGVLIALGWVRPLAPRKAGATLGRGLVEASRAPVQIVGALYELAATPVRRRGSSNGHNRSKSARSDP
ncbi:MAG: magnesium transporter [Candidatus Poriferisodalaceae bacterium]